MDKHDEYYSFWSQPPIQTEEESLDSNSDYEYIQTLDSINNRKKRKRIMTMDDYCLKYGDDIWYLWCIIKDYSETSGVCEKLDYSTFCQVCYENSEKY